MKESDQSLLLGAFRYALEVHAGQTRKCVDIPYASHLLQVAGLVLEAGGDAAQAAAALLHDSLEDCEQVTAAELGEHFGPDVAELVEACSDLLRGDSAGDKSPWPERKTVFLERLARAPARAQLISACDKLHNLRSLVADLRAEGVLTLDRFNAAPAHQRWYYESVHRIVQPVLTRSLALEFEATLATLALYVPESLAPPKS